MELLLKKYLWVLNLAGIAVCATFVGRATASVLVSAVLSGDGPPMPRLAAAAMPQSEPQRSKEIDAILQRNIFCSSCTPIVPTVDKPSDGPVDLTPQRSNLQLQLIATMVAPNDFDWSMAIIRDSNDEKKPVRIYRRRDVLPQGGAIVAQVVDRRVYIVNGKRVEYIDQEGVPPPPPPSAVAMAEPMPGDPTGMEKDIDKGVRCSGSSCEVDKSLIDKLLANTTALATSARFVPSIVNGKPNGFKLYAIRPGSVFAKIGMQNADLIKAINGLDMSTPDKALEAYTKLKSASHLTVQLDRHGENVTLDYQIR